jgi:hypothetical protein
MRVLVNEQGKLDVTAAQGGAVGVRVLDAAGDTGMVALSQVSEEVQTREGATVRVLCGGAQVGDESTSRDVSAQVVAVQEITRAALTSARQWEAYAHRLQDRVEAQAVKGRLESLPVGSAIVPVRTAGEVPAVAWLALWSGTGGLLTGGAAIYLFAPRAFAAAWLSCQWAVMGAWALGGVAVVVLQAFGRPARPWVPAVDTEGRYSTRVTLDGDIEVLARKGGEVTWRPLRGFEVLPGATAAARVAKLEADLARKAA